MRPFEGAAASLAARDATLTPRKQRAAVAGDFQIQKALHISRNIRLAGCTALRRIVDERETP
jgi:hypothetical protein